MKCQSCGAEYDGQALVCPYCGAENEVAAKKEQQAVLKEYKTKIKNVDAEVPIETTKKVNKKVTKIMIGVVIFFFVVLGIVSIIGKFMAGTALDRQKAYIEKLEQYCQNGQYEEMRELIYDTKEIRGATYEKYMRIVDVYTDIYYDLDDIERYATSTIYQGDREVENYAMVLEETFTSLHNIQDMEAEGYPYGEGDIVNGFKEQYMDALRTHFLMTDEEIVEGMSIEKQNNNDNAEYMDLARKVQKHLEAVK